MAKYCVLEDGKLCDDCGKCRMCDLDPNKVCDNCMKCLKSDAEYSAIEIDEVFESEEAPGYVENDLSRLWHGGMSDDAPIEPEEPDGGE